MKKLLRAESTLTDRYQTTIPELIRVSLHLSKRDKITYTVQENGQVLMSHADEDDPMLGKFLSFLAKDMQDKPSGVQPITSTLMKRARELTADVEVDLDAPLKNEDE